MPPLEMCLLETIIAKWIHPKEWVGHTHMLYNNSYAMRSGEIQLCYQMGDVIN